jgi:hypothetical protein
MICISAIVQLSVFLFATPVASPENGRTEVILRNVDVVFSREESFESVLRVPFPAGLADLRVDAARIEIEIVVDGEAASFTPFIIVAAAAEPDPEHPGEYRTLGQSLAREFIFEPTLGRVVHLPATAVARTWSASTGDAFLRILIDEPIRSNREPGSIRFSNPDVLGRVIVLTRPDRTPQR